MAMNYPDQAVLKRSIEDILEDELSDLLEELREEIPEIRYSDLDYSLFDRCEWIGIKAEKFFPDEDLPGKIGVYRGYAGGGVHSSLIRSESDRASLKAQAKVEKITKICEKYFWKILKACDDPAAEVWESITI